MKIKIMVVDKTRSSFLAEGETFYLNRLKKYVHAERVEIKPTRIKKGRSSQVVLKEEGQNMAKNLSAQDYMIALDITGKSYDSEGLAEHMARLFMSQSRLVFTIGGPLGLSTDILNMADETLSLSRLTLTHEMSRLILLEQLYRAFTIIHHENYHK